MKSCICSRLRGLFLCSILLSGVGSASDRLLENTKFCELSYMGIGKYLAQIFSEQSATSAEEVKLAIRVLLNGSSDPLTKTQQDELVVLANKAIDLGLNKDQLRLLVHLDTRAGMWNSFIEGARFKKSFVFQSSPYQTPYNNKTFTYRSGGEFLAKVNAVLNTTNRGYANIRSQYELGVYDMEYGVLHTKFNLTGEIPTVLNFGKNGQKLAIGTNKGSVEVINLYSVNGHFNKIFTAALEGEVTQLVLSLNGLSFGALTKSGGIGIGTQKFHYRAKNNAYTTGSLYLPSNPAETVQNINKSLERSFVEAQLRMGPRPNQFIVTSGVNDINLINSKGSIMALIKGRLPSSDQPIIFTVSEKTYLLVIRDNKVVLKNLTEDGELNLIELEQNIQDAHFAKASKFVVAKTQDNTLIAKSLTGMISRNLMDRVHSWSVSPNGHHVAAVDSYKKSITIFRLMNGAPEFVQKIMGLPLSATNSIEQVGFIKDGTMVMARMTNGGIYTFQMTFP